MSDYRSTPHFTVPHEPDDDEVSMSGSSISTVYMDAPTDFDDTSTASITPTAISFPSMPSHTTYAYATNADYEMTPASRRHSTTDVYMSSKSVTPTPADVSMSSQSATPILDTSPTLPVHSSMPFTSMPTNMPFTSSSHLIAPFNPGPIAGSHFDIVSTNRNSEIPQASSSNGGSLIPTNTSGLFLTNNSDIGFAPKVTSSLTYFGANLDPNFVFDPGFDTGLPMMTLQDASAIDAEAARYLFSELPGITSQWPAPLPTPRPQRPTTPPFAQYIREYMEAVSTEVSASAGCKRKRPIFDETGAPSKRNQRLSGQTSGTALPPTPAPSQPSTPALPSAPSLYQSDPANGASTPIACASPSTPVAHASSSTPVHRASSSISVVRTPSSTPLSRSPSLSVSSLSSKAGPKRGSRAKGARPKQAETITSLRAQVAELKKACKEAQNTDSAITASLAQVLERETNLRHLLSTREKELADLRGRVPLDIDDSQGRLAEWKQKYEDALSRYHNDVEAKKAQYTADTALLHQRLTKLQDDARGSSEEITNLRKQLSVAEDSRRDQAEAEEVQYSELKDRFDTQCQDLSQALDTIQHHRETIDHLTLELTSSKDGHAKNASELQSRIQNLECAYQKLGEDARLQSQALKDDYEAQLLALREQGGSREREKDLEEQIATLEEEHSKGSEAHQRVVQELQTRIDDLKHAYDQLGEDTRLRCQRLKDDYEAKLVSIPKQIESEGAGMEEKVKSLEVELTKMKEKYDADLRDAHTSVTKLQRESQEALRRLSEEAEARQRRLMEESRQPEEMQTAISAAIADARREAEDHFQTRSAEMQTENQELRTEIGNLRTRIEQLQRVAANGSTPNTYANKGKQRETLNVHPYARCPVVAPMSVPRGPNVQPPRSNIPSRNVSPGPSRTGPTISVPHPAPYPQIIPPSATSSRIPEPMASRTRDRDSSECSSREATPASVLDRDTTPTPARPGDTNTGQRQQGSPPAADGTSTAAQALLVELREMMTQFLAQLSRSGVLLQGNTSNRSQTAGVFSQQHEPKPRDAARIRMMNLVRNKLRAMLHIQHDSDIDASIEQFGVAANPADLADYEENQNASPELHPFRPLWTKINHPWNLELAALFAMEFCAEHPEFDRTEVKDHFMTRLKVLHTNVTRNTTHPDGGQAVRQLVRVRSRKSRRRGALYDNRMKIIEGNMQAGENAAWMLLHDMVKGLGLLGMSTDESEPEDPTSVTVIQKDWRAAEVIRLLQTIDRHRISLNCYGNSRSGAQPRTRRRRMGGPVSKRKAVAGLPINWYNPIWYASLSDFQINLLGAVDEVRLPIINEDD
ncbi:hypothetical protein BDN71DRAFT_1504770 [Pleurotus eryngii]|uniref:Uncharacterized protein n=1 Tax=Pleurotus eryngii TaxID=5323 RepID=A0A9P6A054_PLEER|nr:hypothetical protein BDN71DRAFT_1504770 [Pleurotus eryngii]